MPDGNVSTSAGKSIQNIDELCTPTIDEIARQRFISILRNYAKNDLREELKTYYADRVAPAWIESKGHEPTSGRDIEKVMEKVPLYQFYSSIRYNAQEMMFLSVMDSVERSATSMNMLAKEIAEKRPAEGTLRLNPDLEIPRYVTAQDIHLAPGCFHSEYVEDDVSQGAMLAYGGRVSTGANAHRKSDAGAVARSIAYWLTQKYPSFKPKRILDLGTQSGKNLLPYVDLFPEAEAYGVDISAPTLRYGHAKAEYASKAIHFSQQNAEEMDFPDNHFDLIVSSFFFHEVPVSATKRILKECYRLLGQGGMMTHMELPPQSHCDPWLNFYWDWDSKHNNEPSYAQFRGQDLQKLCSDSGFTEESFFDLTIPNYATFPKEDYSKYIDDDIPAPLHGRGGWFIFGAKKNS